MVTLSSNSQGRNHSKSIWGDLLWPLNTVLEANATKWIFLNILMHKVVLRGSIQYMQLLVTVQLLPWVNAMKCVNESIWLVSSHKMSNWARSGYKRVGSWIVLITVMTLIAFNRHLSEFKVRWDTALFKSISSAISFLSWKATKISIFLLDVEKSASLAFWILEISWLSALENPFSVDSLKQLFGVETSLPGNPLKTTKKVLPKQVAGEHRYF